MIKYSTSLAFYLFSSTHLINSIKHEHSCNILYVDSPITMSVKHRTSEVTLEWEGCLKYIWAVTCDFQRCGILTRIDSDKPVQPPFKLRSSKWCSVSSLTLIEYASDKQRLWSDCTYAQAGLSFCWSHTPNCWKSHATAHIMFGIVLKKTCFFTVCKFVWLFPCDDTLHVLGS